ATAVFAFDDLAACGVVAGLADRGLRVPRDRSVIGCDDVLLARVLTPSLTTITAPVDDLGLTAVRMLEEAIAGRTPESVRLPGSFVPRASTGPATTPWACRGLRALSPPTGLDSPPELSGQPARAGRDHVPRRRVSLIMLQRGQAAV